MKICAIHPTLPCTEPGCRRWAATSLSDSGVCGIVTRQPERLNHCPRCPLGGPERLKNLDDAAGSFVHKKMAQPLLCNHWLSRTRGSHPREVVCKFDQASPLTLRSPVVHKQTENKWLIGFAIGPHSSSPAALPAAQMAQLPSPLFRCRHERLDPLCKYRQPYASGQSSLDEVATRQCRRYGQQAARPNDHSDDED